MIGSMPRIFDTPLITNDQSFDRLSSAGLPVLLILYQGNLASDMSKSLENLAKEHAGKILVARLNVQENPATRQRYPVTRLPGLVALRGEQIIAQAESVQAGDLNVYANRLLGRQTSGYPPESKSDANQIHQAPRSASRFPAEPVHITDALFEREVVQSDIPVLVDFWAPWCGPCRTMDPVLKDLARELSGRLKIAKLNVDENPQIAGRFGVQSIPTMLVMRNGQVADHWVGAIPGPALRSRLARWLAQS